MKQATQNPYFLSILGGILLFAGWPTSPLFPLLFIGIACLLLVAKRMIDNDTKGKKYFLVLFSGLLTWNVLTTWWILYATPAGMLMAVIGNSLLMYIPFLLFRLAHKVKVYKITLLVFISSWLGYEYLHHNWSLTWPWITLGNGLANFPSIIQWYEYTGTAGGSLWILIVNALIYSILERKEYNLKKASIVSLVFIAPILLSLLVKTKYDDSKNKRDTVETVVLQPNYNTYTQKSRNGEDFIPYDEQVELMISSSKKVITQQTEFLVWPETAITGSHRESYFHREGIYRSLKQFLKEYPDVTLITGLDSYEVCPDQNNPSKYASHSQYVGYYEPYNASIMITADTLAFYHKAKFVPGAEQIPFTWMIEPIEMLLGGVGFGQFFGQEDQVPFTSLKGRKISPSICYESIFGEHMAEFVQNGTDIHFVITNDDWWHDTEGHRQHYEYTRLRAIETRRPIARSGNTGFSGFFDIYGNDTQKTKYRVNACIKQRLPIYTHETFYMKYGDYIGKTAAYLAVLLIISLLVKRFTPKT